MYSVAIYLKWCERTKMKTMSNLIKKIYSHAVCVFCVCSMCVWICQRRGSHSMRVHSARGSLLGVYIGTGGDRKITPNSVSAKCKVAIWSHCFSGDIYLSTPAHAKQKSISCRGLSYIGNRQSRLQVISTCDLGVCTDRVCAIRRWDPYLIIRYNKRTYTK